MEINTPIAEDIRVTDQNSQYDAACRRLLSDKTILAWIMKSCLAEYRDCDIKEIAEKYIEGTPQVHEVPVMPDETNAAKIRGVSNVDTSRTEGTVIYDIRFLAVAPSDGELIQLIVNVEAQGQFYVGYPLIMRAIYYCSRMISAQYGTEFVHEEYQNIKKVYSVFICMDPPKNRRNSITRYRLTEENLVGNVKEPVRHYDLMTMVMVCLGGADGENYDGILKLLDVLLSPKAGEAEKRQVLQEEFDIPMTETLEAEVHQMCNLSQGVMELGRAEGMAQGMDKGMVEGFLASIRNLMANTGWSLEKAMETLGVPETDRPKYTDLLQKQ